MLQARGMIKPSRVEVFFGLINVVVLITNVYLKYEAETMIFMLNPCHFVAVRPFIFAPI